MSPVDPERKLKDCGDMTLAELSEFVSRQIGRAAISRFGTSPPLNAPVVHYTIGGNSPPLGNRP